MLAEWKLCKNPRNTVRQILTQILTWLMMTIVRPHCGIFYNETTEEEGSRGKTTVFLLCFHTLVHEQRTRAQLGTVAALDMCSKHLGVHALLKGTCPATSHPVQCLGL